MAGKKGRSGRKPKPDALKIAAGTYRSDRSGNPEDKVVAGGRPKKPDFDNSDAEELWDLEVEELEKLGVLSAIDAPLLQSMCEMWGLYRASYRMAERLPIDKDCRIAVTAYWAKFEQAAARFGLNPTDRSRLKVEKPSTTPQIKTRDRG